MIAHYAKMCSVLLEFVSCATYNFGELLLLSCHESKEVFDKSATGNISIHWQHRMRDQPCYMGSKNNEALRENVSKCHTSASLGRLGGATRYSMYWIDQELSKLALSNK